jgi:transposase
MLKAEGRMELEVLRKHGSSIRELARVTLHSRNTVRRYLREGDAAATRKPAPTDGFKDYIVARLNAAAPDRIPSTVLFREVRSTLRMGLLVRRQTGAAIIMPQVCLGFPWFS